MKHIFKNKAKNLYDNMEYHKFKIGKRELNGKLRRGCYYFCSKLNKEYFKQFDNVVFLTSRTEFAPEIKHVVIFIFD